MDWRRPRTKMSQRITAADAKPTPSAIQPMTIHAVDPVCVIAAEGPSSSVLPGLYSYAGELDLHRLCEAAAVDVVVAGEARRLHADAQGVLATVRHGPVAPIVVEHRMPQQ